MARNNVVVQAPKKMYREDNTRIQMLEFVPPDYKITHMIVSQNGVDRWRITFAMSPTSFNENRQNSVQLSKTNGGWFAQRMGPQPVNLSFDGFMLDAEGYLEKHQFLDNWKNFLEDKKTTSMEYKNDYTVRFVCMGREYFGYMQSISFITSATRPFLHQYSGVFVSLKDHYIYKPDQLKVSTNTGNYALAKKAAALGRNIYQILTK